MATRNAILKAMIESQITEIMVKSNVEMVYMEDGTTTLASKLATMVADIAARPTSTAVTTQINEAISELIGSAPETYDTLQEIAEYIESHEDVVTALNEAIGNKLDKSVYEAFIATLGSLATKSSVSESDLDSALREKVNAASEGNHSHNNKALLDTYTQTEANLADAVAKKHEHANKDVIDGITAEQVAEWDAEKARAEAAESALQTKIDKNATDITNMGTAKADKATTLAGYGITDAYTKTEVDGMVASTFHYKGTVATYADLPTEGQAVGDVYNITAASKANGIKAGDNVAWNGTDWDVLAGTVDLSAYSTTEEINAAIEAEATRAQAAEAQALTDAKAYADEVVATEKTRAEGVESGFDTRIKAVEGKAHEHDNKAVLDGITADKVTAWDDKARVIVSSEVPSDMTAQDLLIQLV